MISKKLSEEHIESDDAENESEDEYQPV